VGAEKEISFRMIEESTIQGALLAADATWLLIWLLKPSHCA
jgi:hypothetical protein